MRTIENCRTIRHGLQVGAGQPEIKNGLCGGYCTEQDDEPFYVCKRCRFREGNERTGGDNQ
jgi:hypothetical protein